VAEKHPELAVAFMTGMSRVGRWASQHTQAAAEILNRQMLSTLLETAAPLASGARLG
jgi:ABC-type nitrate/sulfonate/bicarbonate transport system substrate-binding protein